MAMASSAEEFFDQLSRRRHEHALERVTGTIRCDLVDGSDIDHWFLTIAEGDIAVSRNDAEADAVLRTDRALFDQLAGGEEYMLAAWLRGAASADGDLELLILFERLLPGRQGRRSRRPAIDERGRVAR
jgi:hypothetical protein